MKDMHIAVPDTSDIHTARFIYAGRHKKADNAREHAHICPELILIVEGSCCVELDTQTLYAGEGDIIIIPAHQTHNQISDGFIHTLYCGFIAPPSIDCPEAHVIHLRSKAFIENSMQLMADVSLGQIQASQESMNFLLASLLTELQKEKVLNQKTAEIPPLLRFILRYIDDNLSEPITLETLAKHTNMSISNLNLLFRKHLKTSPIRYLSDQRMRAACSALRTPYLSVKEVAAICGYSDVNHFVRVFRKTHGLPPGQWRKEQENDL